jgi:hypothetical protein
MVRRIMSATLRPPLPFRGRPSDEEWKKDVKGRINLRELVPNVGRDHKALCLWHEDNHPSLHVYADHVHCFSCQATEDVFGYLMKAEGLTFPQAMARAAGIAGMSLPMSAPPGVRPKGQAADAPAPSAPEPRPAPPEPDSLEAFCNQRGLKADLLQQVWGVRFGQRSIDRIPRRVLSYPTPINVTRYKVFGALKRKYHWARNGRKHWYGLDKIGRLPAGPLYLVNGEPSVWAAYQAGVRALCMCIGEGTPPDTDMVAALQKTGHTVVRVVYDLDREGIAGARKTVAALQAGGIAAAAHQLPADLGITGDVGDLHRRVGDGGLAAALAVLPLVPDPIEPAAGPASAHPAGELAGEWTKIPGGQYFTDGARVFSVRMRGEHADTDVHFPWCPEVIESVQVEGGETGHIRHYKLRVGEEIAWSSEADLRSGDIWEHFSGSVGHAGKTNLSVLHNLVLMQAQSAPRRPGYGSFGWHEDRGEHFYVWPDGHTTPPRPDGATVHVADAPESLVNAFMERTAWPEGDTASDLTAMVDAVGFVLDMAPDTQHGLLALGAAARSLVDGIDPGRTTLILEGPPGSGKTGTACIARGLVLPAYRRGQYEELATGSFNDTSTALEQKIARERSWPPLIDDLAIPDNETPAKMREHQTKIDMVVRSRFNHSPMRERSTRDGQALRHSHYIAALPILTAESLPPDTAISVINRCILLQVTPGSIDTRHMRDHGAEHAHGLSSLGQAIISRYAGRLADEGTRTIAEDLRRRRGRLADQLKQAMTAQLAVDIPQEADRLVESGSEILIGVELIQAEIELSLIDAFALPALARSLAGQINRMNRKDGPDSAGPFGTLMRLLAAKIAGGVPISGSKVWRIVQQSSAASTSELKPVVEYRDGTPWPEHQAGWREEGGITAAYVNQARNALYLPDLWRDEMRKLAAHTPGCMGLTTDTALGRAAEREGWITVRGEDGCRRKTIRHRGAFHKVWTARLDMFLEDYADTPSAGPSSAVPEEEE